MQSRTLSLLAALTLVATPVLAQTGERATPREARAVFDRAVRYLEQNGPDKAFPAFNDRKGGFSKKDAYVFVIDKEGTYRANGAAPEALVGINVLNTNDAAGTPLFRNMLDAVTSKPEGVVNYQWLNRKTNHVEPKTTFVKAVGDYVVGVGYFAPRATAKEAQNLLDKACDQLRRQGGKAAYSQFNNPKGGFIRDDLYVFAVNLDTGKFLSMGASPRLVGTDARDLSDAEGHSFMREMIEQVQDKGEGSVTYMWRNPVTNAVEKKNSFVRKVGNTLVGVGYYQP